MGQLQMNKLWIGTNWKMHKTVEEGRAYTAKLLQVLHGLHEHMELFIIPPHTSLWPIKDMTRSSRLRLGAQNMHWEDEGAYTGEISPKMLNEIGIDLIELGHSERRQYYNENDEDINKKAHAALRYGMKPLICIGENEAQKRNGVTFEVISSQLKICLNGIEETQINQVLIAYEPVWAIGHAGVPAEAEYVDEIHQYIRSILNELYPQMGKDIPILYGGSVNLTNYLNYLTCDHVNGLFIGRAAWDIESFRQILVTINSLCRQQTNEMSDQ